MGKPRPADDKDEILYGRRVGLTVAEISQQTGWSASVINRILKREGETDSQEFNPTPEEIALWCKRHESDLRREHPNMEGMRA